MGIRLASRTIHSTELDKILYYTVALGHSKYGAGLALIIWVGGLPYTLYYVNEYGHITLQYHKFKVLL